MSASAISSSTGLTIKAVAEVVAALGVIITLIYLAVQIRQSTEQSKLSSAQAIDTSNMLAFDAKIDFFLMVRGVHLARKDFAEQITWQHGFSPLKELK